jgi:hypothetical protein
MIATLEDAKTKKLLALFTQSVEEDIIGKDENDTFYTHRGDGTYPRELEVKAQNNLRAEQRARLATLIKQ